MWFKNTCKTQIGLHTISNGGGRIPPPKIQIYWGPSRPGYGVRSGMAKLLSIPKLERRGFRIQLDTFGDWVVISPRGRGQLVFQRDTGRCDRLPFVDLDDPKQVQEFFDAWLARSFARKTLASNVKIVASKNVYIHHYFPTTGWSPRSLTA